MATTKKAAGNRAPNTQAKKPVPKPLTAGKTPVKSVATNKASATKAAVSAKAHAVVKTAPVAAKPVVTLAAKAIRPDKPKKPKLVRDSFTIPKVEYAVLDQLKQRIAMAGSPAKKSEVLRAGIKALAAMTDTALLAAMAAVPAIKTGRPAND